MSVVADQGNNMSARNVKIQIKHREDGYNSPTSQKSSNNFHLGMSPRLQYINNHTQLLDNIGSPRETAKIIFTNQSPSMTRQNSDIKAEKKPVLLTLNPAGNSKPEKKEKVAEEKSPKETLQVTRNKEAEFVSLARDSTPEKTGQIEESTLVHAQPAKPFVIKWTSLTWPKIEEEIRVEKLLGQGSFAKVYQGFDLINKNMIAVKVLDKRKICEMGFQKMAEKEIEIVQQVRHPSICRTERILEDKNRVLARSNVQDLPPPRIMREHDTESILQNEAEQAANRRRGVQDLHASTEGSAVSS